MSRILFEFFDTEGEVVVVAGVAEVDVEAEPAESVFGLGETTAARATVTVSAEDAEPITRNKDFGRRGPRSNGSPTRTVRLGYEAVAAVASVHAVPYLHRVETWSIGMAELARAHAIAARPVVFTHTIQRAPERSAPIAIAFPATVELGELVARADVALSYARALPGEIDFGELAVAADVAIVMPLAVPAAGQLEAIVEEVVVGAGTAIVFIAAR